jgi:hypothetical protein
LPLANRAVLDGVEAFVMTMPSNEEKCLHPKAIVGLDAFYCSMCQEAIKAGTAEYQRLWCEEKPKPLQETIRQQQPFLQAASQQSKQLELIF